MRKKCPLKVKDVHRRWLLICPPENRSDSFPQPGLRRHIGARSARQRFCKHSVWSTAKRKFGALPQTPDALHQQVRISRETVLQASRLDIQTRTGRPIAPLFTD